MPILSSRTEDLSENTRSEIIELCVAAYQKQDFRILFTYVPSTGGHIRAYRDELLVSHAMVTTRWLQPEGYPLLKTAYGDAVSTLPAHQGKGYGSAVLRLSQCPPLDFNSMLTIECQPGAHLVNFA